MPGAGTRDKPKTRIARRRRRPGCLAIRGIAKVLRELLAFGIRERAGQDHDEVDQGPDAEAASRHQLQDARARLADVEPVNAGDANEETQEEGGRFCFCCS